MSYISVLVPWVFLAKVKSKILMALQLCVHFLLHHQYCCWWQCNFCVHFRTWFVVHKKHYNIYLLLSSSHQSSLWSCPFCSCIVLTSFSTSTSLFAYNLILWMTTSFFGLLFLWYAMHAHSNTIAYWRGYSIIVTWLHSFLVWDIEIHAHAYAIRFFRIYHLSTPSSCHELPEWSLILAWRILN